MRLSDKNENMSVAEYRYDELKRSLSRAKKPVFIIDDKEISPIEIILIASKHEKSVIQLQSGGCCLEEDGDRRLLRVIEMEELPFKKQLYFFLQKSFRIQGMLYEPFDELKCFILLTYQYVIFSKRTYVTHRGMTFCMKKLHVYSQEGLRLWYSDFLKAHGLRIYPKGTERVDVELIYYTSTLFRKSAVLKKKMYKVMIEVYYRWNFFVNSFKKRYSYKAFIESIHCQGNVKIEETVSNDRIQSMSGAHFAKGMKEGRQVFVKGAKYYFVNSIRNEIEIQKKIIDSHFRTSDCFLVMSAHSSDFLWIEYPYVNGITLEERLRQGKLDDKELRELGIFLVCVVDELYKMKIDYCDLKASNIMIRDEQGAKKYVLIDFGTAMNTTAGFVDVLTMAERYRAMGCCGQNRYNDYIIDDAASALLVYIDAGGNYNDDLAMDLNSRIGRQFYPVKYKKIGMSF